MNSQEYFRAEKFFVFTGTNEEIISYVEYLLSDRNVNYAGFPRVDAVECIDSVVMRVIEPMVNIMGNLIFCKTNW